ncbi:Ger(x)C family spore germination protein [Cohnella luojiensis]|uniref:Ger(X)C family spore germination protein n=1 Tax=Cohnella luojiensis TaxID=652876 RepID=A0A4Y8M6D3_9BACL|nr:Ger(x)C family spore germination protein [Cohnella luojiensis]TFE30658.1 Ger(x)C family spore germination protein [Cohnella luojiensis]
MRRARIFFSGFALLLIFSISGCGFKDIDKRFFVVAMGIDRGSAPSSYRVTVRLAIPTGNMESGETKTEVETMEAPSIAEAVRQLKSIVDKELDFGHCRVILFGRTLMEDGVDDPINWLSRRRDIQQVAFLGMAEPDAFHVLKLHPQSERYPGNALFLSFGSEGTESSYTLTEYLFDWVRRQSETGKDGFLPIIRTDKDRNSYRVDRVAFTDKEKLRLCLDPEESQLFNISARRYDKAAIAMPYQGTRIVFALSQVITRVSITRDDVPTVTFHIRASGFLEESPPNFMEGDIPKIESRLQAEVNNRLVDLLNKIRGAEVDPYGFGLHYLATYFGNTKDWEHWKKVYPEVVFRVQSRIVIEKVGLVE